MKAEKLPYEHYLSLQLYEFISKDYKALLECSAKEIRGYDLSGTEFSILELFYHKKKVRIEEIGKEILITSRDIMVYINQLEKKGYINRVPSKGVNYAHITKKGTELIDNIFPIHSKAIDRAMHGLTNEEKKIAITLIKKFSVDASKDL
ncbi:MarR family 2-MHQ and catechol resistance regulon transcriptional repressor [Neobacillus niacini]|uniref:MarR family winged helix-turn-helix transcriptional regulator n=1 Tax=Neobacillus driksii TaxID=3035913 RepID=UPI00278A8FDC|nr:MarR family transcriptional regulator [Neobacillus niacini]MDQ0971180.1 MarR family 2-MHQ and catechol resistance regulon transcriptional repressor [Neobacillus niacini]